MRDLNNKCLHKETLYKDVVVIGNGPSGISLSYMLSGHWPYWMPEKIDKHPDELLRARLNYADNEKSLVDQDLVSLADGLEGRSTNPVSLLLDSLTHPCADLGMELPSMLNYKFHPDKQIDHIVLGKGPAGGSWHRMDPNLRTLSLSAWMSLPGLDFNTWESLHPIFDDRVKKKDSTVLDGGGGGGDRDELEKRRKSIDQCQCSTMKQQQQQSRNFLWKTRNETNIGNNNESETGALCCHCTKKVTAEMTPPPIRPLENDKTVVLKSIPARRNLSLRRESSKEVQTRALISRVAEYYESYVKEMELEKYFMNDVIVTSVNPLRCYGKENCGKFKDARWIVTGIRKNKPFYVACKNVVLANGSSDLANRLGLRSEGIALSWVKYELPQLETALEAVKERERLKMKPVLIVGAGLSAADAVTICRSSGIHVIHVYRNRTAGLDKMLPENVYPEYHQVHKMMKDSTNTYDLYTPLPEHTIIDLSPVPISTGIHRVTVQHLKTGETRHIEVSFCAILIGSRPDLRFLNGLSSSTSSLTSTSTTIICTSTSSSPISLKVINDKIEDQLCELNNEEPTSRLARQISWLKNICAKCRHINLCERVKRNEYKRICGHNFHKTCECNKIQSSINVIRHEAKLMIDENIIGVGLGEDPEKPIDCKTNPIAVDKYTNQILKAPKGLFAMGPLVGDNFVRFIPGGALAITSALHKEND